MKTRVYLLKSLIFNGSLKLNKFVGETVLKVAYPDSTL